MEKMLNDHPEAETSTVVTDLRTLTRNLARFREPNHGRSVVEVLITIVPFVLLWLAMWLMLPIGYGFYLLLAAPAAGFLVRLFMIQHDCGHGSLFRHRFVNDWLGRVIGVLTLTPYDFWRRAHGIHHATSGNLDRRGSERLSRKLRDLLKDCVAGEYISDWAKEQFPSEWENKRNFVASGFVKSK